MGMTGRRWCGAALLSLVAATGACTHGEADAAALTDGGDAARGKDLIRAYGCGSCHTIPRLPGALQKVRPRAGIGIGRNAGQDREPFGVVLHVRSSQAQVVADNLLCRDAPIRAMR